MVIRRALLTGLAVLALTGDVAAGETEGALTPSQCTAAMIADFHQTGVMSEWFSDSYEAWNALTFHEKDGPLKMVVEATRLGEDAPETQRLVAICRARDPMTMLPKLPPPPAGDDQACNSATLSALAKWGEMTPDLPRYETCKLLDEASATYRGVMSDLEGGRLSCEQAEYGWVRAGAGGMTTEIMAMAIGCRNGTVTPNMAMLSGPRP